MIASASSKTYDAGMGRSFQSDGIILRTWRFGEIHKGVEILTPDEGMVGATVFGAYKGTGKLGGSTDLFSWGRFFFYRDPVKNRIKVQDVQLFSQFEPLRHRLDLYYIACFWGELIKKSLGAGGDTSPLYRLLIASLKIIVSSNGDERTLRLLFILFGWHFLSILGLRGPVGECSACGIKREAGDPLYISREDGSLHCGECAFPGDYQAGDGSRHFLWLSDRRKLSDMVKTGFGDQEEIELKELILHLLKRAADEPLSTSELI
jgi:DNA repair protein RecO (recombination protein O)